MTGVISTWWNDRPGPRRGIAGGPTSFWMPAQDQPHLCEHDPNVITLAEAVWPHDPSRLERAMAVAMVSSPADMARYAAYKTAQVPRIAAGPAWSADVDWHTVQFGGGSE